MRGVTGTAGGDGTSVLPRREEVQLPVSLERSVHFASSMAFGALRELLDPFVINPMSLVVIQTFRGFIAAETMQMMLRPRIYETDQTSWPHIRRWSISNLRTRRAKSQRCRNAFEGASGRRYAIARCYASEI